MHESKQKRPFLSIFSVFSVMSVVVDIRIDSKPLPAEKLISMDYPGLCLPRKVEYYVGFDS